MEDEKEKKVGMATASFVCGFISLLISLLLSADWDMVERIVASLNNYYYQRVTDLVISFILGIILGILAIIFGIVDKKRQKDGLATAGLVIGIISSTLYARELLKFIVLILDS